MRILYVIDSLAPGGAETSLLELTPYLASAGIDLLVLPLTRRLDLKERIEQSGGTVLPPSKHDSLFAHALHVYNAIKATSPDLVHTTLFQANIAGRIAAMLSGRPCSASLVGDSYSPTHYAEVNPAKLNAVRAIDRWTARIPTRFHAVSNQVKRNVGARIRIPSHIIDVIPRGRSPERYPFRTPESRERARAGLEIGDSVPVILAVGRQEPAKGLKHLVTALGDPLVAAHQPVTLLAGKPGRDTDELKKRSVGLQVRFLGHRDDIATLLAAADLLCFPSLREGSPGTLIEALAVGCPIVCSDIAANREIVGDPENAVAILVDPVNETALARGIDLVLNDPLEAYARCKHGRQVFEDQFTISRAATELVTFFEKAAAQPRSLIR